MAGKIKGITIELSADTSKLDKALRDVQKNTKAIDKELNQVNKGLKFNPTSVELWRQKQTLLNKKVDETDKKLKLLKEKQKDMNARGVDKNSEEYRKLQREIVETESKLKRFKSQLIQTGNAKLTALGEQFKAVGKKMTAVGKNLTMKVTAPLTALGTVAAKKFADVDKVMQLTNATMANSAEEAEILNNAMKKAAASSTYGMNDAATATLNFARAGLDAQQAADALAPAMALAAGEGGNLDTVSGGLVATINGFHGSFEDAAAYADVFANACNNSALDVNSLSTAMSVAAPIFASAGYNVKDAALFMGVMANNGIEANKAANSLKTGIARLVSPAKDGATKMEELGLSMTNADGTMKDTITIQKELHEAFSKLSESEQIAAASAIFGKNQMAPWLALINTAPGDVSALNEALGQTGTAMEMQSSMMSGFAGSIEQLKSGIDVLMTSLGEALAPVIQKVVGWIQQLVDWFNGLDSETQSMIATIGMVVAAIGPVLIILGTLASAIGSIISLVGSIGTALTLLSGPVGIAIGIIAGLVAAGVWLYKNWDMVKEKAGQLKDWVVEKWTALKDGVSSAMNAVKEKVISAWNSITAPIKKALAAVQLSWKLFKVGLDVIITGIKNSVAEKFAAIKEKITKPIKTAVETVTTIINKIKSIIGGLKLELPRFKLPHFKISGGKIPWGIGGMGEKPSINVEWYKRGAIFTKPTIAGLGEAGPEGIIPLDVLWRKMDNIAAASGGGDTFIFNISNAKGLNESKLIAEVKRQLIGEVKSKRLAWGK